MNYLKTKINDFKKIFNLDPITSGKWNFFFSLFSINLITFVLTRLAFTTVFEAIDYNPTIKESLADQGYNLDKFIINTLLSITIVPVFEEIVFRLGLSKNIAYQFLGIIFITLLFNYQLVPIVFIAMSLYAYKFNKIFPLNIFSIVLFALIFASFHIENSIIPTDFNTFQLIYIIPVVMMQTFFSGILFSLSRIRLGLKWAILQHSLINLFISFLTFNYFLNQWNLANFGLLIINIIFLIAPLLFILSPWFDKYQKVT